MVGTTEEHADVGHEPVPVTHRGGRVCRPSHCPCTVPHCDDGPNRSPPTRYTPTPAPPSPEGVTVRGKTKRGSNGEPVSGNGQRYGGGCHGSCVVDVDDGLPVLHVSRNLFPVRETTAEVLRRPRTIRHPPHPSSQPSPL